MSKLAELQQLLLRRDIVLKIKADIIFPRVGGYNARPYSSELDLYELPRPSELKALWRWWMRAILAGLCGGRETYDKLEEKVSELLGSSEEWSYFTVVIVLPKEAENFLKNIKREARLVRALLTNVIPQVLEEFISKWSKECRQVARLKHVDLSIPVTIRFEPRKGRIKEFEEKVREFFGVDPRLISGGREAEVKIESTSNFKRLIGKLNSKFSEFEQILDAYDKLVKIVEIPRIRILLQPRKDYGEDNKLINRLSENNKRYLERISEDLIIPERIPVEIIVIKNRELRDSRKIRFAIATLILALILGGVGSITRRGFGSIVPKGVELGESLKNDLKEEQALIEKVLDASDSRELENALNEYIRHIISLGREIFPSANFRQVTQLPEIPSLIPSSDYFRLRVLDCKGSIEEVLKRLGQSTLKAEWKKEAFKSIKATEAVKKPGGEFHTWILGLPRRAKYKERGKEIDTGYCIIDNKPERRPSAISFKVFENKQSKKFIIVYGFLSKDWPLNRLIHKGKLYPEGKRVKELGLHALDVQGRYHHYSENEVRRMTDEQFLKEVFNTAFRFILNILKPTQIRGQLRR